MTETVTTLEQFAAPWGREVTLQDVVYENGFRILRMRIREGKRITIVDLDPATAGHWGAAMAAWAARLPEDVPVSAPEG
ncbi:MAG: hypothetical protein HQL38_01910 [Alphaproteobacteria bacterium]|nr:hypothetical protein [Alphaproteobacteria bacterium]MBF0391410.1 hypothetical protein [Alphaproteobacteria bacterium]